jgi:hypothetical protein
MILILIVYTKKDSTFNLVALYLHIHLIVQTLVHSHFFLFKILQFFFSLQSLDFISLLFHSHKLC